MHYVLWRRVRATIVAVKKAINITHCECVYVAFGIPHAMRMDRITLSSVACPAVPYFPQYLFNGAIY